MLFCAHVKALMAETNQPCVQHPGLLWKGELGKLAPTGEITNAVVLQLRKTGWIMLQEYQTGYCSIKIIIV